MARGAVTGDREIVAALRALSKPLTAVEIDRAAIKALDPMLKDAKRQIFANRNYAGKYPGFPDPQVPRKGGHVDQGVVVRKQGFSQGGRAYKLGATRRARYLLHLLEFGTAPHFQPNFKGGFMHPGARPRPALVPAYEAHKDEVPAEVGREVFAVLAARAMKLAGRNRKR